MEPNDKPPFLKLLEGVYDFYARELSPFSISVWWEAMRPFSLAAVSGAFNRHCVNPDNGQYCPKPADIVKLIGGTNQDQAMLAWVKVDKSVRSVGIYQSVVFDDPVIHRVIHDMGGWIELCGKKETEWPFVQKEFENRYRGYRLHERTPDYPPRLTGLTEAQNARQGYPLDPPILIGDEARAKRVLSGGSKVTLLPMKPLEAHSDMVKLKLKSAA